MSQPPRRTKKSGESRRARGKKSGESRRAPGKKSAGSRRARGKKSGESRRAPGKKSAGSRRARGKKSGESRRAPGKKSGESRRARGKKSGESRRPREKQFWLASLAVGRCAPSPPARCALYGGHAIQRHWPEDALSPRLPLRRPAARRSFLARRSGPPPLPRASPRSAWRAYQPRSARVFYGGNAPRGDALLAQSQNRAGTMRPLSDFRNISPFACGTLVLRGGD